MGGLRVSLIETAVHVVTVRIVCAKGTVEGGNEFVNGGKPDSEILMVSAEYNLGANEAFVCLKTFVFLSFGIANCFCLFNLLNFIRKIKASLNCRSLWAFLSWDSDCSG